MELDQNDLMSTYASGKFYVRELFFSRHMDEFKLNPYRSPMFDLIKTSCKSDLKGYIHGFLKDGSMSKSEWKRMAWDWVWELENTGWRIKALSQYCRTHSVRVCLYIAYIACGSASLYIKTLYFFLYFGAVSGGYRR